MNLLGGHWPQTNEHDLRLRAKACREAAAELRAQGNRHEACVERISDVMTGAGADALYKNGELNTQNTITVADYLESLAAEAEKTADSVEHARDIVEFSMVTLAGQLILDGILLTAGGCAKAVADEAAAEAAVRAATEFAEREVAEHAAEGAAERGILGKIIKMGAIGSVWGVLPTVFADTKESIEGHGGFNLEEIAADAAGGFAGGVAGAYFGAGMAKSLGHFVTDRSSGWSRVIAQVGVSLIHIGYGGFLGGVFGGAANILATNLPAAVEDQSLSKLGKGLSFGGLFSNGVAALAPGIVGGAWGSASAARAAAGFVIPGTPLSSGATERGATPATAGAAAMRAPTSESKGGNPSPISVAGADALPAVPPPTPADQDDEAAAGNGTNGPTNNNDPLESSGPVTVGRTGFYEFPRAPSDNPIPDAETREPFDVTGSLDVPADPAGTRSVTRENNETAEQGGLGDAGKTDFTAAHSSIGRGFGEISHSAGRGDSPPSTARPRAEQTPVPRPVAELTVPGPRAADALKPPAAEGFRSGISAPVVPESRSDVVPAETSNSEDSGIVRDGGAENPEQTAGLAGDRIRTDAVPDATVSMDVAHTDGAYTDAAGVDGVHQITEMDPNEATLRARLEHEVAIEDPRVVQAGAELAHAKDRLDTAQVELDAAEAHRDQQKPGLSSEVTEDQHVEQLNAEAERARDQLNSEVSQNDTRQSRVRAELSGGKHTRSVEELLRRETQVDEQVAEKLKPFREAAARADADYRSALQDEIDRRAAELDAAVTRAQAAVHDSRVAFDSGQAQHDAAVQHAVQERYEAKQAESEARVDAAEQAAVHMRETTEVQMDNARTDLHAARDGVKDARHKYETAKAELDAGLKGKLDDSIAASGRRVEAARNALEDSRKGYEEARTGNEPRHEELKLLREEVEQGGENLRDELIEHEALLTAAGDRSDDLEAVRTGRGEAVSGWRSLRGFDREVARRSIDWQGVLRRRESDATAASRVEDLRGDLEAKEAAYPQAVEDFKGAVLGVIEERLAAVENAKTPDRDAYEEGLADKREAMRRASRKALEAADAVQKAAFAFRDEVLRRTSETDPMIGPGAADDVVDRMARDGSRAERVAAMSEWMTRRDPDGRTPRETQMLAYVLTEFGPADMKGGEGKTLVVVMAGYRDARVHGVATTLTSSDPLVMDMVGEVTNFLGSQHPDSGVDVVTLKENEPFPQWAWKALEENRSLFVVGTKEGVLFVGLHEAHAMVDEIERAGASEKVVADLRAWLRTEPHLDALADHLDAVADEYKVPRRFKPIPEGVGNFDEVDTAFDGETRAILSPGAGGDAEPETEQHLKDVYEKFRIAVLAHGLTDKDFGRPENTRGLWHARLSVDAFEKLARATEDPESVLADAEHFAKFALARWGLERDRDYNTSREHDMVMLIDSKTTDKLSWGRDKSTSTRLQDLGQYLDIVEGVTVRANHPEDSLTMSLKQWIGSRFLKNPKGVSGTAEEVAEAIHDSWGGTHDERGDYFGVPAIARFYKSNLFEEAPAEYTTHEKKLAGMATDVVDTADISFVVKDGTIVDIRQEGRTQWNIMLDNKDIHGAHERVVESVVDKPGGGRMVEETRTALNRWQDKKLPERGVTDWVDAIVDRRMKDYAAEHGLQIADGVKLRYSAIDARWYEEHGGGDGAEREAGRLVEKFGKPGSIMFINKSGARGTDPKPTAEAKELGGVFTRISGGPAFSRRVLLQAIWRSARGGSGEDRVNGGTPGSAKIYTSPEDYRTEIEDAQATREIIQYLNAVDERDRAAAGYETAPSAETREAIGKANNHLDEAVRVLREETTPRLQRRAEEQLQAPHRGLRNNPAHAPPAPGTLAQRPRIQQPRAPSEPPPPGDPVGRPGGQHSTVSRRTQQSAVSKGAGRSSNGTTGESQQSPAGSEQPHLPGRAHVPLSGHLLQPRDLAQFGGTQLPAAGRSTPWTAGEIAAPGTKERSEETAAPGRMTPVGLAQVPVSSRFQISAFPSDARLPSPEEVLDRPERKPRTRKSVGSAAVFYAATPHDVGSGDDKPHDARLLGKGTHRRQPKTNPVEDPPSQEGSSDPGGENPSIPVGDSRQVAEPEPVADRVESGVEPARLPTEAAGSGAFVHNSTPGEVPPVVLKRRLHLNWVRKHSTPGELPREAPPASLNRSLRWIRWIRERLQSANRNLIWLYTGSAFSSAGSTGLAAVIPLLIEQASSSISLVSLATSAAQFASLLALLPSGYAADKFEPRRTIRLAAATGLVATSVAGGMVLFGLPGVTAGLIGSLVVTRVADTFGGMSTTVYGRRLAVTAEEKVAAMTLALVDRHASGTLGNFIFPVIANLSHPLLFASNALSYAVNLATLRTLPPVPAAEQLNRVRLLDGARAVWDDAYLRACAMFSVPWGIGGAASTVQLIDIIHSAGYSPVTSGLVLAGGAAGTALAARPPSRLTNRLNLKWLHPSTMVSWAGWTAELALTTNPAIIGITAVLVGAAVMSTNKEFSKYQAKVVPERVIGAAISVSQIANGAGGLIGGLVGGYYLLPEIGIEATGWVLTGIFGATAAASAAASYRTRTSRVKVADPAEPVRPPRRGAARLGGHWLQLPDEAWWGSQLPAAGSSVRWGFPAVDQSADPSWIGQHENLSPSLSAEGPPRGPVVQPIPEGSPLQADRPELGGDTPSNPAGGAQSDAGGEPLTGRAESGGEPVGPSTEAAGSGSGGRGSGNNRGGLDNPTRVGQQAGATDLTYSHARLGGVLAAYVDDGFYIDTLGNRLRLPRPPGPAAQLRNKALGFHHNPGSKNPDPRGWGTDRTPETTTPHTEPGADSTIANDVAYPSESPVTQQISISPDAAVDGDDMGEVIASGRMLNVLAWTGNGFTPAARTPWSRGRVVASDTEIPRWDGSQLPAPAGWVGRLPPGQ